MASYADGCAGDSEPYAAKARAARAAGLLARLVVGLRLQDPRRLFTQTVDPQAGVFCNPPGGCFFRVCPQTFSSLSAGVPEAPRRLVTRTVGPQAGVALWGPGMDGTLYPRTDGSLGDPDAEHIYKTQDTHILVRTFWSLGGSPGGAFHTPEMCFKPATDRNFSRPAAGRFLPRWPGRPRPHAAAGGPRRRGPAAAGRGVEGGGGSGGLAVKALRKAPSRPKCPWGEICLGVPQQIYQSAEVLRAAPQGVATARVR